MARITMTRLEEDISFSAADGCPLVGTLTLPGTTPAPVVVAAHGSSTGTRSALLHRHLTDFLPRQGVGAFVFDRRGEGQSGGVANAPLAVLSADVASAVAAVVVRTHVDQDRIGLWGHSQGGWVAPLAAAQTPIARFMVIVAGSGVSPAAQMRFAIRNLLTERGYSADVLERALSLLDRVVHRWSGGTDHHLAEDLTEVGKEPWYALAHLPAPDELRDDTFEFDLDPRPTLRQLRIPALLIYGEADRWVPIEESIAIWREAYGAPEMLTVARLPGSGHFPTLPTDPNDLDESGPISPLYEDVLAQWLGTR
jgi:uncharacterized protein